MIPGNSLSNPTFAGSLLVPDNMVNSELVDWERGGVALNDPSQGLRVQNWTAFMVGNDITIKPDNAASQVVLTRPNIETLSLAFDQNMNIALAYTQAGAVFLYFFDTVLAMFVEMSIPGASQPRLAMDDKRPNQVLVDDIILAYVVGSNLFFRQQRDRFTIERLLYSGIPSGLRLKNIGINNVNRLQFNFDP